MNTMSNFDKAWKTKLSDLVSSRSNKLNDWEIRFVSTLYRRSVAVAKFGWQPSEREMECLEKISAKVV